MNRQFCGSTTKRLLSSLSISRLGLDAVALLIAILGLMKLFRIIAGGFRAPPEWDFLCFYLWSAAARAGLSFYSPEDLRKVLLPVTASPQFTEEIIGVGMPYPPPTMSLFYPLSLLPYSEAYLVWMAVQFACLLIAVFLLIKETSSKIAPPLVAALVLFWPSTHLTFIYAQTNFALLSLLLLSKRSRSEYLSGFFLALGFFVKPLAGALFLYPVLKRQWRVLLTAATTLAAGFVISAAFLGSQVVADFFLSASSAQLPPVIYTELVNQSLLSTVLRTTEFDFQSGSPLLAPEFLVLGSILLVSTAWLLYRSPTAARDEAFALNLVCGLLIYPGTLVHYGAYLLIALTVLLMKTSRPIQAGVIVFAAAALGIYQNGALLILALLGLWLMFALRLASYTDGGNTTPA